MEQHDEVRARRRHEGGVGEPALARARAKARQQGLANVEFRSADVERTGLPPASFDAVVCVFGIFFLPDMTAAVAELWRLVRPGGVLAVTVWGPDRLEPATTEFWAAVGAERPLGRVVGDRSGRRPARRRAVRGAGGRIRRGEVCGWLPRWARPASFPTRTASGSGCTLPWDRTPAEPSVLAGRRADPGTKSPWPVPQRVHLRRRPLSGVAARRRIGDRRPGRGHRRGGRGLRLDAIPGFSGGSDYGLMEAAAMVSDDFVLVAVNSDDDGDFENHLLPSTRH